MNIERIDIAELHADPANARSHDRRNIESIAASLKRFGQQKPVVVGRDGVVIAGNGTLMAARTLGWKTLAAVRTQLNGGEATAYAIADNRTAELADWDEPALGRLLKAVEDDTGIHPSLLGFDRDDMTRLLHAADDDVTAMMDDHGAGEADGTEEGDGHGAAGTFEVIVSCDDATQQRTVYERLRGEGLACRLSTL